MRFVSAGLLVTATAVAQTPPPRMVPDWLVAGPMIGHVGQTSAKIWVQVAKGVKLRARATLAGTVPVVGAIDKLGDRLRRIEFTGLAAGRELVVQLYRGSYPTRGVAVVLRTAAAPARHGRVRVAFGSCLNDVLYQSFPVFGAVARERPDVFLFVGDNTYYAHTRMTVDGRLRMSTVGDKGDWTSEKKMFARQIRTRRNRWLQPMLGSVPCYAVWDDHDYGPNNADRLFKGRKRALRVFKRMWANPDYGSEGTKGCFSSFRRGPIEVFLMDCRYHKLVRTKAHPEVPEAECRIWGAKQLRWLCQGLRRSDAPVKLIANGTQFLYQGKTGEGHYQEARAEYRQLLDYLHRHRIGGVVFLTGDRHHSELMQLRRPGRPLLIDFTSSPLGQNQSIGLHRGEEQPTTVWKMRGDSYGLVTIEVKRGAAAGAILGSISCEVRNAGNRVPVLRGLPSKTSWQLSELHYPPVRPADQPRGKGRGK